jgi:asparagine synthase (glutamine-hydrolysing)
MAVSLGDVTGDLCRDYYEDGLDVRYPFLFKPLVEYCLALPFDLRERPLQPKWILRSAMQGILPDSIRLRTGKGGIGARVRATIWQRRSLIDGMVNGSILASLGIIKPAVLRQAIARVNEGHRISIVHLTTTLSLESWLRVTTGTVAA